MKYKLIKANLKTIRFIQKVAGPVRVFLKDRFDSITNARLQQNLLNAIPFWLGALLTGIVAVIYAKLFLIAEEGTIYLFQLNKWLFFAVTPICFIVSWWLVSKYAPFSRGSGIPQVSASIELANPKKYHLVNQLLSIRVLLIKIISSLIMVFGGGVVGREGPTIQIAGSIFKKINDWLPEWYPKISKKNMLITGAASGLAAAFNTPLGGIVFAIEELTKTHFSYFKSALLTGVIIAGLTALNILGPYLYLGFPTVSHLSWWIIFPAVVSGGLSGYLGSTMTRIILYVLKRKSVLHTNTRRIIYCIVGGLLIAASGILINEETFGTGKELMQTVLLTNNKYVEWYVPLLRFFGPIISFTNGGAGGVFAPALSAGASIGSAVADWFQLIDSNANLIILCGMVGFLTGVTRSPFTSAILVLEMTTAESIIFYLMIAGLIANLVSSMVSKHSFYDQMKDQYLKELESEEK
ncbi:chloride channel protein [Emticicia sp. BO119]|uniref:chloride channel protein n=1 Tax=Emticicia sp. BO119 TaxID=2757768 RepID=UPI0015F0CC65|nr:chloride channel protein [Emticicia sp. BO119]MBA4852212.1 chloride channel protein [Emticicia sp. BO119]